MVLQKILDLLFVGEYTKFKNLANEDQLNGVSDEDMHVADIHNIGNFEKQEF